MKKNILIALLAINTIVCAQIKNSVTLDEFVISASKEQLVLREQPLASYKIDEPVENKQINSLKDISAFVPNFYIPDYGSKITSTIYVRGISSRMNEPSVGLYVDNIPYLDKSGFDFDFFDIASVTLLQGPQGTLYGRNSIGGLVNITTLSPLDFQGTKLSLSYGNYNDIKTQLSHYHKINNKIGLSIAGYYNRNDGYFTNVYNNEKNSSKDFGGRAKLDWRISETWKANLNLNFTHTNQNAYPYENLSTGEINYNEDGSYSRDMATAGLSFQHTGKNVLFTSTTSFQYLKDQMNLDQDFTTDSIFKLSQNQKQQSYTQEFVFRSNNNSAYQWTTGAFGFYKKNAINTPMYIYSSWLRPTMGMPAMLAFDDVYVPGLFDLENIGAAIYHQSAYTFLKHWTVTAGIRVDYEKTSVDYQTEMGLANMTMTPPMPGAQARPLGSFIYEAENNHSKESTQILPKAALKYAFNENNNIYASVTKGYKAGGYNYNTLSTFLQDSVQVLGKAQTPSRELGEIPETAIYYKPETSWNYEVGAHASFFANRLLADAAVFYSQIKNQQMSATAPNGSRMITNADEVESYGAEISLLGKITSNLSLSTTYGYTHSSFKKYIDEANEVDYSGNFVPFVPQNTLSVGANYDLLLNKKCLDKISFAVQGVGVGKIYWNEENSVAQDFYATLNAHIAFVKKSFELRLWGKNLLNKEYDSFFFESMGNYFVQKGRPLTFGVMAKFSF